MRAHTIITEARVRGRGRTKRTILTLSLAVALFAPTASSAGAGRGPYLSEGEPSVTSGAGAVKFKGHTNQGGATSPTGGRRRARRQGEVPSPAPVPAPPERLQRHNHPQRAARRVDADRLRRQDAQHRPRGASAGEVRGHRGEDLGHRVDRDRSGQEQVPHASRIQPLQDGRDRLVGDARLLTAPAMRGMECAQPRRCCN